MAESIAGSGAATGWLGEWIYAHRGLHDDMIPENSLAAARGAIAAGLGIECDIQRSADGAAMVFHDWELDRLTRSQGLTEAHSKDELQRLRYPGGDEGPATLSELLQLIAGQVPLLIEVKSKRGYDVDKSCEAVASALNDYSGCHAVMSFDPRVGRWFSRHSQRTVRGLVFTEEGRRTLGTRLRLHGAIRYARAQFLAYDIRDLPSPFAAAHHSRGLPLLTWTVKTPELRERARLYADAPIAEGPGLALEPVIS